MDQPSAPAHASHNTPGLFIVIEGIDGAGKTTQADLLGRYFANAGVACIRSKEPTDGPWGQKIRQSAMAGRMPFDEELDAFIKDREQHLSEKILPALSAGSVVILDRYLYSTIAYQGARLNNPDDIAPKVLAHAPVPDTVLVLDCSPTTGLHRIAGRGDKPNTFEEVGNLTAVRSIFRRMPEMGLKNIEFIDANPSVEEVRRAILRHLLGDGGAVKTWSCAKPWGCDGLTCIYRMSGECRWVELYRAAELTSR